MLSLILALLSDPTTPNVEPDPRVLAASEARAAEIHRLGTLECGNPRIYRADIISPPREPRPAITDLLHRSDDTVRGYLLLERRVNGCSTPISFDVRPDGETLRRR